MLKVNHIQKTYSHFHLDCSLEIQPGSITGQLQRCGLIYRQSFLSDGKIQTDADQIGRAHV